MRYYFFLKKRSVALLIGLTLTFFYFYSSGMPGLMDRMFTFTQKVEGSVPISGSFPNDFSDPIDQDIRNQFALSWKIVVSERQSVIAVSMNVGGGIRLIKPAKLYICAQNTTDTTRTYAGRWLCAAMVPYR